jgi:hypothetical protein
MDEFIKAVSTGEVELDGQDHDYISLSFAIHYAEDAKILGDGSYWVFDVTTVQPDITAFELAQIMSLRLSLPDGIMQRLKSHYRLLRHFRRE